MWYILVLYPIACLDLIPRLGWVQCLPGLQSFPKPGEVTIFGKHALPFPIFDLHLLQVGVQQSARRPLTPRNNASRVSEVGSVQGKGKERELW